MRQLRFTLSIILITHTVSFMENMSVINVVNNKRKLNYPFDYQDVENKCDWNSHIFKLNQLAFVIWNHIYLFQLFPLCSVHRSWQERIWKFQDTSSYAKRVNDRKQHKKVDLRKGKRMKLAEIEDSIALIQSTSSNNITSGTHQYLFQIQFLQIRFKLPVYSRICTLFSLLCNLKQLNLISIGETNVKIICQYCKLLNTLNLIFNSTNINMVKVVNSIINLPRLQQLLISTAYNRFLIAGHVCLKRLLENCKTLEHLSLSQAQFPGDIAEEYCNGLKQLKIGGGSGRGGVLNAVFPKFNNLTHLHIVKFIGFNITNLIPESLPNLVSLTWEADEWDLLYRLSEADVQSLGKLKNLEELNFHNVAFNSKMNLQDLVKIKRMTFGITCQYVYNCLNSLIESGINQQLESLTVLISPLSCHPPKSLSCSVFLQFPKLKQLILSPPCYRLCNSWISNNIIWKYGPRYLQPIQLKQIIKVFPEKCKPTHSTELWTQAHLT